LAYSFSTLDGRESVAYVQPAHHALGKADAFVGSSAHGWFAVLKDSGGLITQRRPKATCPAPVLSSPQTNTLSDAGSLCPQYIKQSLSVRAISPGRPSLKKVHASDRIAFTVSVRNESEFATTLVPAINLEDLLEYSRILDTGGGEYDYDTRLLSWPSTSLSAGETLTRIFIVQAQPHIPATAQGQHVAASYDCAISATFGNTVALPVACPPVKYIERVTNGLPPLSAAVNVLGAACLLLVTLYFYLRSRQLLTELYIIRYLHLGSL
jgi:hypothetical protein